VIGVFYAASFGLGIVLASLEEGYSGGLASFLFGQILGVSTTDVVVVAVLGSALLAAGLLLRKEFTAVRARERVEREAQVMPDQYEISPDRADGRAAPVEVVRKGRGESIPEPPPEATADTFDE
jgi:hypothetical protein